MTLPQFWQNLFFRFCLFLVFSVQNTVAESPGIIDSLQKIMDEQKNLFIKKRDDLRASIGLATPISQEQFNESIIHPDFIAGVILNSAPRYLYLLDNDVCNFSSLVENSLIKSAIGSINEIPVIVKSNKRPFLLSKEEFIKLSEVKCPGLKRKGELFSPKNLRATLNSLKYPEPKNTNECHKIVDDWKENNFLPYLCRIPNLMTKGRNAKYILEKKKDLSLRERRELRRIKLLADSVAERSTFKQRQYFGFLCDGLLNKERFCNPYLAADAWTKILNRNLPSYLLEYKCHSLYGKKKISTAQFRACALKVKTEPELCYWKSSRGHPALLPANNCDETSDALQEVRLKTDYNDCPGLIMNNSLNNIQRLYAHFNPEAKTSNDCSSIVYKSLADLYFLNKIEDRWPLNICYFDRIEDDRICKIYIPGEQDSEHAEDKVVTGILKRMMPLPTNNLCKVVTSDEFNPVLLEYKVGCHIIKDMKNCRQSPCPRRIVVKEKTIEGVEYIGTMKQNYIPSTYAKKRFAGIHILEESLKIKNKSINNFTELMVFFKQKKKGVIHGVGCIEDLLPEFFQTNTINSCKPMSFIIDGIVGGLDNKKLVFRSAIDHVHAPRMINWQNIFDAVSRYRDIHPLKNWTLYGAF